MEIGYIVTEAAKWDIDPERYASEFDAGYGGPWRRLGRRQLYLSTLVEESLSCLTSKGEKMYKNEVHKVELAKIDMLIPVYLLNKKDYLDSRA